VVDAERLAGFILELSVAACRARLCVGETRETAAETVDAPIESRAGRIGFVRAGVAWLLRVTEWLTFNILELAAWTDLARSSVRGAREAAGSAQLASAVRCCVCDLHDLLSCGTNRVGCTKDGSFFSLEGPFFTSRNNTLQTVRTNWTRMIGKLTPA
jgi:hypothetical protein